MAEQHDSSLIGFDPLAWLVQEPAQAELDPPAHSPSTPAAAEPNSPASDKQPTTARAPSAADTAPPEPKPAAIIESSPADAEGTRTALALEAQVGIQHVAQLHQQLVAALQTYNSIDIDASAVNSIDTASLQLLVILKQTALQEQKTVAIDFPSDSFIEAANVLGLSELLDVDHPASGLF